MSDVGAHDEDRPATLPFPVASGVPPSESFAVRVPPSNEWQLVVFEYFKPSVASQLAPIQDQVPVVYSTGATMLVAVRPSPPLTSSLSAGGA